MTPDKRGPAKRKTVAIGPVKTGPDVHDEHDVVYFRRHPDDSPSESAPGRDALNSWPTSVRANAYARLAAVAEAPPYRFSGGGYWEAMSADMAGIHELRVDGAGRRHYRLFCVVDAKAEGASRPYLAVITGLDKPFLTEFSAKQYSKVKDLRNEYLNRNPRSLVTGN